MRQATNHLAKEKSPYLLQHKDNPVHWFAWGPEAFEAAKKENKIIFLSIGYSTCYWCHMMEKDSFELQEVADVLNKNFISIKVDREEHPDVDQIYMDAVVGMAGQGGWPLSVFLTPDLKPFYGGTFFWKQPFLQLLGSIQNIWQTEPGKVLESSRSIISFLQEKNKMAGHKVASQKIGEEILQKAFAQFRDNFDSVHGGFGGAPKFPPHLAISLLLRIHRRMGNEEALTMATKTLDAMAKGGIYDSVGGGFHRYATKEDWDEPHYEKMLYDNALLAWTYLEAAELTHQKNYKTIAKETLDYVIREMTDPLGGFYSAQDAGEVGKEGEYYRWTEKNIEKEREDRRQRKPPHKDDKILTSWNGLMIAAMAKGHQVLKDEKYLKAAEKAVKFIEQKLYKNGELLRRYRDGEAKFFGTLDDYSFLIHGLLALYESNSNPHWVQWAKVLQQKQDELFWDEKEGGYFFSPAGESSLIIRNKETHDGAIPSGNAVAALNLLRLFDFTKAEKILSIAEGAQALIALDYFLDPANHVCENNICKMPVIGDDKKT